MRLRQPLLYHQYIGQYETTVPFNKNTPLSERLLADMIRDDCARMERDQIVAEDARVFQSQDTVTVTAPLTPTITTAASIATQISTRAVGSRDGGIEWDDVIDNASLTTTVNTAPSQITVTNGDADMITEDEIENDTGVPDREGFMRLMQERFVDGQDAEYFSYAEIDEDTNLDDIDMVA